ncbi:MAG TPA: ATP-binding cassette domain-containing protein, partial [Rhodanobacteraceae bacterium]|nr:ATP-binding cassette domain-containing protein [Rhodanobacteraceae bacterium]
TLLRILAGLDRPDSGSVKRGGEDFLEMAPRERKVGLVFQHYALFRHMSVTENIAFGLRVRPWRTRPSRKEVRERVQSLLQRVKLEGLGDRYPMQLSGGQRQRVGLARALAVEPDLLLLDEPFGALDAQVRVSLRRWLRELHDELKLTTIFVTHDQEEALELSDRVALMNSGRIEQVDTPAALYQRPATPFVCEFIGRVNRIPLALDNGRPLAAEWRLPHAPWPAHDARQAVAYVRPEQLSIDTHMARPMWKARLRHVYLAGSVAHLNLHVESMDLVLEADIASEELHDRGLHSGMELGVLPRAAVLFPLRDGAADPDPDNRWEWREWLPDDQRLSRSRNQADIPA